MLVVKFRTLRRHENTLNRSRMSVSPAKWVNLTAICVFFLTVLHMLPAPANGFTPIGGVLQNGEGRKLFGGYRITPKHCRGTKTLPLSDPRSKGPTICMFNHECAQRNGEVVGACMDGFLFGACCQVPQSSANENTLIKDAQNPLYQSNTHSTEGNDPDLYASGQKFESSNEFQEIQSSSTKLQDVATTQSSYIGELSNQKVHKVNKTSTNNKIFYVNKGSVMVSSPSSISLNDDYVMLSSSTIQPHFGGNNNRVSFTTELPMKISTDLVDHEDSTNLPVILTETGEIKKNFTNGALDFDAGEFTHSDITHPGAESVLIDNDLQFSTGFGGPQSVYVPPPAHAAIIPPKRRPAQRPSVNGPSKKPTSDKFVLIQTLDASKKPPQAVGTTSTGISTNFDSIESIILMLNGTKHGPSYDVAANRPSYNQQSASYGQSSNYGTGTTQEPAEQSYHQATTSRPVDIVTTGSVLVFNDQTPSTTPEPSYYQEVDTTRRPPASYVQESTEQTSNKYNSVEMSDEKPSFVEIPSPPHKVVSDKVDVGPSAVPPQGSYNIVSGQVNYAGAVNAHKDAANPDYGYTSPGQPTSDFNKMPAVGQAYPVMDEETSAYFEASMLSEEDALSQNSQQTEEVADKNIPAYSQKVDHVEHSATQQRPESPAQSQENKVQSQAGYTQNQHRPDPQPLSQGNQVQSQSGYTQNQHRPDPQPLSQDNQAQTQSGYTSHQSKPQQTHHQPQGVHHDSLPQENQQRPQYNNEQTRPSSQYVTQEIKIQPQSTYNKVNQNQPSSLNYETSTQNYEKITQSRPSAQPSTQDNDQTNHNRPLIQKRPSAQRPAQGQNYEHLAQNKPSTLNYETSTQNYEKITQSKPSSQPSTQDYDQTNQNGPSPPTIQTYEPLIQTRPSSQRPAQEYEQISQAGYISHPTSSHVHIRPTSQVLTTSYEIPSPSPRPGTQPQDGYPSQPQTTHIIRPTTQVVTQGYEVQDLADPETPRPTQEFTDDSQDDYDQVKPTSQLETQSYEETQESDYVSQSSEAANDSYQTPESQVIAQLTNQLNNGYLTNSRPSAQEPTHNLNSDAYLPRPTAQSAHVQAGYLDSNNQPTATPVAQVIQHNNVLVQAGYLPPSFEHVQPRPTIPPNRISTLIVQQSTARPTTARPTKPVKIQTSTYSHIETNYPSPTQTTGFNTISSTSTPLSISSTSRPSKRPTKRVTKRPSGQKKRPPSNDHPAQPSSQNYNQPPPEKYTGVSLSSVKPITSKPGNKKRPPSTSYLTGPTTPRPEVEVTPSHSSRPTPITDKVDTFVSSSPVPGYNSIYLASPTDEIILQNAPSTSNHNNYNKPLFVKIPSATVKPPSPTVIITPKPTVVNLLTASSPSKRPTTTPIPSIPTFAGSNSYLYGPLITRRPELSTSTQQYGSIPHVTSNDFDDPGYSALHTLTTTQVANKIPTDDRPAFPGYYGPTPTYPTFEVPNDKLNDPNDEEEETYTSPSDFVNFPPVRNPNLNMSVSYGSVTNDVELSTPAFVEDTILKDKMNTLVHKIVESLQGNFEALAEMIDDNNNTAAGFSDAVPPATTVVTKRPATKAPTRKPPTKQPANTARPTRGTTKKPPTRVSTPATTKRPAVTTKKPIATTRKPTTKRPVTRKPTRKATTTTTTQQPVQEDEIVEEEEDVNNEVDSNIGEDSTENDRKFQCGVRPHVKSGRIVGGKRSQFGEFPWQVLVRESTWLGLFTKNKCGGVLITNKYVITAAHCQPGFLASLVAVMGEFDISGELEEKRSVTKNVKRVIVHRQYDPATFENDLALLELESPVNYDTHIVPICMPADTADFTGRMATVTGWGRLKYGGGVPSVLYEVQVPVIENSVCQEMFHTAGHNKKILNSFLCAGYANGQKDSCEGDSGGPLVLQRADGRYELAGTVSHGIKCAAPYLPGVYMRTTYYKPWLKSITGVK